MMNQERLIYQVPDPVKTKTPEIIGLKGSLSKSTSVKIIIENLSRIFQSRGIKVLIQSDVSLKSSNIGEIVDKIPDDVPLITVFCDAERPRYIRISAVDEYHSPDYDKSYILTFSDEDIIYFSQHTDYVAKMTLGIDHFGSFDDIKIEKSKDLTFGYFGEISYKKGVNQILAAFDTVVEKYPKTKLRILGSRIKDTDLHMIIRKESKNRKNLIYRDGWLPKTEQLKEFIASFDVGIFASKYEGFGLCPLECAGLGVPSIIPRHSGYMEYIDRSCFWSVNDVEQVWDAGYASYIVDHMALSDIMLGICADPNIVQKKALKASVVSNEYTWERSADIVLKTIQNVLVDPSRTSYNK